MLLLSFNSMQQQEVAMFRKFTVFAVLLALVSALIPFSSALAKGENKDQLQTQWSNLTTSLSNQAYANKRIHNEYENWLKTAKNVTSADKAKFARYFAITDSAYAAARTLAAKHPGFDMKGNVTSGAAAGKTVAQMAQYMQQHSSAIKNIRNLMKQN
jgi:hypothetical protein